jgi:dTDP-4-dehydrorhamnose reductase
VRVKRLEDDTGFGPRLREAWERYGIPIAITEVHHGCHRDEQLRWFAEVWKTAKQLRAEGMDLRAVTIWSMFGNVDWRFLLTQKNGFYDTGAFDVRGGEAAADDHRQGRQGLSAMARLRPSGARRARLVAAPAAALSLERPLQGAAGWGGRKLLITGATGTLGNAFARICEDRALPYCLTTATSSTFATRPRSAPRSSSTKPWAIINTAGFVRVADAERERDACLKWNADGPAKLAAHLRRSGHPARHLLVRPRLRRPARPNPMRDDRSARPTSTASARRGPRSRCWPRRGCARDPHQRLFRPVGQI